MNTTTPTLPSSSVAKIEALEKVRAEIIELRNMPSQSVISFAAINTTIRIIDAEIACAREEGVNV